MSRGIIACQFLGRLGNCMFSYAFARSYAERNDLELQVDPWIGSRVFGLNDPPIDSPDSLQRVDENTIEEGMTNILYRSYSQQQKCLTYTRKDCLRWFQFADEIHSAMRHVAQGVLVAHFRRGDMLGYGYPVPSAESYERIAKRFWPKYGITWVSEENPFPVSLPPELKDVPDFYRLAHAPILLRANSTFSWWAGVLNHGAVYSPVMTGAIGGQENDCQFVRGNWPAFRCDLPFLTDLHLPE